MVAKNSAERIWIKAIEPIVHDGERIAAGVVCEIERLAAEALIALGAARAAPKSGAKSDTKATNKQE